MPSSNIYRGANIRGYATPTSAPIFVDSDDSKIKAIPAGSGTTEVVVGESSTGLSVTTASGSIGYGTGAGGAVTQITSSSTGVTLSKPTGQITTVALTTAAGAEETFTVTNTLVAATDTIVVSTTYAGAGTPLVFVKKVAAGSFDISITNVHATAALDALMVINFALIKGVAA